MTMAASKQKIGRSWFVDEYEKFQHLQGINMFMLDVESLKWLADTARKHDLNQLAIVYTNVLIFKYK